LKSKQRDSRARAATGEGAESAAKALQRQAKSKPRPADAPTAPLERKQSPAPKQERHHWPLARGGDRGGGGSDCSARSQFDSGPQVCHNRGLRL